MNAITMTAKLAQVNDYRFVQLKDVQYDWKRYDSIRKDAKRNTRVYVQIKGETILENLMERHSRPYKLWQPLIEKVLSDAGITYDSIRWSQKAGCRCGCSPAFILAGSSGRDVWVEIS